MKKVFKYINILEKKGYKAYIVGGYVRDFLLGKKSFDIDICTNATPSEIISLFKGYKEANDFGGILYKEGKYNIEITTFRKEIKYLKRKPIEIEYLNNLQDDLPRRDFTINTICMDGKGKIYDFFDGKADLKSKIVRSLENPNDKFKEDPLRMLRAIRFATVLDFDIEKKTLKAIKDNSKEVGKLSSERIKEEFDKILLSPNFLKGFKYLKETQIADIIVLSYKDVKYVNNLFGMYAQIDSNINLSRNEELNISKIKSMLNQKEINNFSLFNAGLDLCLIGADILGIDKKRIIIMEKRLPIKKLSDIKLNGNDIMQILNLKPSKKISEIIFELKKLILCGKIKNTKKDLTSYVKRMWQNE